jgi:hypothetical protein
MCMFFCMFYEHTKGIQNRTRIVYDEMDIEWAEIVHQKWTLYSHAIWTSTYIFRISHLHAINVDVLVGVFLFFVNVLDCFFVNEWSPHLIASELRQLYHHGKALPRLKGLLQISQLDFAIKKLERIWGVANRKTQMTMERRHSSRHARLKPKFSSRN